MLQKSIVGAAQRVNGTPWIDRVSSTRLTSAANSLSGYNGERYRQGKSDARRELWLQRFPPVPFEIASRHACLEQVNLASEVANPQTGLCKSAVTHST